MIDPKVQQNNKIQLRSTLRLRKFVRASGLGLGSSMGLKSSPGWAASMASVLGPEMDSGSLDGSQADIPQKHWALVGSDPWRHSLIRARRCSRGERPTTETLPQCRKRWDEMTVSIFRCTPREGHERLIDRQLPVRAAQLPGTAGCLTVFRPSRSASHIRRSISCSYVVDFVRPRPWLLVETDQESSNFSSMPLRGNADQYVAHSTSSSSSGNDWTPLRLHGDHQESVQNYAVQKLWKKKVKA